MGGRLIRNKNKTENFREEDGARHLGVGFRATQEIILISISCYVKKFPKNRLPRTESIVRHMVMFCFRPCI